MTFCPPPPKPPPRWQWRKRRAWREKHPVGDFSSFIMPVIKSGVPTDCINELFAASSRAACRSARTRRWLKLRPWWQRMLGMSRHVEIDKSEL